MNILIAPNSMKGSLSAIDFANIAEEGLLKTGYNFNIRKVPVADGGDGTGEILIRQFKLKTYSVQVKNPVGKIIEAKLGFANNVAVIEMADASGMKLLTNQELNPMIASSYGTGELIRKAHELGANKILLCIGGSATVDGGMGMLEALGVRFFDIKNNLLKGNGNNLQKISSIDCSGLEKLSNTEIKIISDVTNPLLGKEGAANVFGPQKGATVEMVKKLESGLKNFSSLINSETGVKVSLLPGSGAAGGLAIGLVAFMNAEIVNGADFILDLVSIDQHIQWSDIVITGEGKLDDQTFSNKAPYAVAIRAKKQNKPIFAIVGQAENFQIKLYKKIISLSSHTVPVKTALKETKKILAIRSSELGDYLFSHYKL